MNNIIGTEKLKPIVWMKPEHNPIVEIGEQELFWIATENEDNKNKVNVYLACFINKPIMRDDGGDAYDWVHCDESGENISAIGWHNRHEHYEFSNFYVPIEFKDGHELLAWAEYTPPRLCGGC